MFAMASLLASPLAEAQGRAQCSPAGTWYGGSEGTAKYIASITPLAENRFNIVWSAGFSVAQLGFPVMTLIPGEFQQKRHGQWEYEGTAAGFGEKSNAFPPATYPDLWVVHYRVRVEGCNIMIVQHDLFGGYTWASNKTPFVDQPDYPVAPTPIVETYKRLPGKCPICVD